MQVTLIGTSNTLEWLMMTLEDQLSDLGTPKDDHEANFKAELRAMIDELSETLREGDIPTQLDAKSIAVDDDHPDSDMIVEG